MSRGTGNRRGAILALLERGLSWEIPLKIVIRSFAAAAVRVDFPQILSLTNTGSFPDPIFTGAHNVRSNTICVDPTSNPVVRNVGAFRKGSLLNLREVHRKLREDYWRSCGELVVNGFNGAINKRSFLTPVAICVRFGPILIGGQTVVAPDLGAKLAFESDTRGDPCQIQPVTVKSKPKTKRKSVITSVPSGGRAWAYGYADLAQLLGTTEAAVRQLVYSKRLIPSDLLSVCRLWLEWNESDADSYMCQVKLKAYEHVEAKQAKKKQKAKEAKRPAKSVTQPNYGYGDPVDASNAAYAKDVIMEWLKKPQHMPISGPTTPPPSVPTEFGASFHADGDLWGQVPYTFTTIPEQSICPLCPLCLEIGCDCATAQIDYGCNNCGAKTGAECICASKNVHMFKESGIGVANVSFCTKCGKGMASPCHAWWSHKGFCLKCDSVKCGCAKPTATTPLSKQTTGWLCPVCLGWKSKPSIYAHENACECGSGVG